MDLLYSRYASPLDLINRYLNSGRFGEFVDSFLTAEYERRKEDAEKDEDWKLWVMYCLHIHSLAAENETFEEWKKRVIRNPTGNTKANQDAELTDDGINAILNNLFSA